MLYWECVGCRNAELKFIERIHCKTIACPYDEQALAGDGGSASACDCSAEPMAANPCFYSREHTSTRIHFAYNPIGKSAGQELAEHTTCLVYYADGAKRLGISPP